MKSKTKPELSLIELRQKTHDALSLINKLTNSFPDIKEKN